MTITVTWTEPETPLPSGNIRIFYAQNSPPLFELQAKISLPSLLR